MNDNEQFYHFLLKIREALTLMFDFNIPNGKPIPDPYRDILFVLYKVYYNGEIDSLAKEPLLQANPVQLKVFSTLIADGLFSDPDISSDGMDGIDVDYT